MKLVDMRDPAAVSSFIIIIIFYCFSNFYTLVYSMRSLFLLCFLGVPSFPALYTVLRPSGLPVGTILALCEALRIASVVS
jgi:hypothetical protein